MRKDVRFGLAIGGVLLAVLIVYVLVVPGESAPRDAANQPAGTENLPADGRIADRNTGAEQAAPQPAYPATPTPQEPVAGPAPVNQSDQATPTAVASNTGETNAADPHVQQPAPTATASRQRSGGAPDWNQLLAFGEQHQPQANDRNVTPVAPETSAGASDRTASVAPGTPSSTADRSVTETWREPVASATPERASDPASSSTGSTDSAAPAGQATTYVVRTGDTLSSIARDAYGSPNYYPHIQRANPNLDPRRLRPGMVINLPDRSQVVATGGSSASAEGSSAAPNASSEQSIDPSRQYRVQSGDSLYRISVKLYGNAEQTDKLYELNRQVIGSDPAKLKVGMVLQLPAAPTVAQSR